MVKSSADAWPSSQYVKSPYLLSIFRNRNEAAHEIDRVKDLATLAGSEAPILESEEYDFINASLFDLASFTLDMFQDSSSISNEFILIIDSRSARDRTVLLAQIPEQVQLDDNKNVIGRERKFNKHDTYIIDPQGWLDSEGNDTGEEELKSVRVKFEDANLANMLADRQETIGTLAMETFQTDGVYTAGASYPDPQ